jgi:uncharacterized membrane protein HdeD (DUF308 family)
VPSALVNCVSNFLGAEPIYQKEIPMNLLVLQSVVSIAAGLLIFIKPELLNYIVAIYLIVAGAAGLAIALA